MAKSKKMIALIASAVMACSAVGCNGTRYSAKCDGKDVNAGIYIGFIYTELLSQMQSYNYGNTANIDTTKGVLDKEIDGKDASEYIKDKALINLKEYLALKKQFEIEDISISDEELETIEKQVKDAWRNSSELFEKEGINKESLKEILMYSSMKTKMFSHYYEADGVQEVSDDDMKNYFNDNFLRYKTIQIPKEKVDENADDDKAEETKKKNEENEALYNEYFDKAQNLSYAEFDSLIKEYNDYKEKKAEEEKKAVENEQNVDENNITDENADTDEVNSESTDENTDETEVNETETSEEDVTAEDTADEEKNEDPNANDRIVNYELFDDEDLDDYMKNMAEMMTEIKNSENNKVFKYENDDAYYIIVKGDISERTDYIEQNKVSILQQMKEDDFQDLIDGWVNELDLSINNKALKKYTPEEVYVIYTDFFSGK